MTNLPAPLTPADCDLRDFAFMPLDVVRLRDSDLAVTADADEFRCAVLLWCASWHQVPAASLPDDDKALAQYAGYGRVVKEWLKVREGALRGWIKCSDGRLYHEVVAEKANNSWIAKLKQRLKTECARIKKHNDRHGTRVPFPDFESWMCTNCPVGHPLPVPRDNIPLSLNEIQRVPTKTPSKGEGDGEGHGQGEGYLKEKDDDSTDSNPITTLSSSIEPEIDMPPADDFMPPAAAAPPMPEMPSVALDAAVILSLALRREGVSCKPDHYVLKEWAASGVTLAMITEAVSLAREAKGDDPIHPAYLAPIVTKLLNPPQPKSQGWRAPRIPGPHGGFHHPRKPRGDDPKGLDESYSDYAARISRAEAARRKGQP